MTTPIVVVSLPELVAAIRAAVADGVRAARAADAAPVYLSPSALASHYSVSRSTVHVWLASGLPSVGAGKARRIAVAAADEWLASRPTREAVATQATVDADPATRAAMRMVRGSR